MTKLGALNYFLQFLFIRVAKCQANFIKREEYVQYYYRGGMKKVTLTENKSGETKCQWYSIIYFIVPFTGWVNNFIYIGSKKSRRLTFPKEIRKT